MTELTSLFVELGFSEVKTYIQSGNVVFKTGTDISSREIAVKIEKALTNKYGFDVPVLIRTYDEMKAILQTNPFRKPDGSVPEKIAVTFLDEEAQSSDIEKINPLAFLPDKFIIHKREIYLDCAGGFGTTKLSNNFFEKKLKVKASTRNWNTVCKLIELAEE